MKPCNQVSALILAGGKSSRMGQDKALIPINHQPLLQRVCHVAIACCSSVYILTPWSEQYDSIVPSSCQFLPESQSGQGPLIAFAEGLKTLQTEWILLLACDLPQLNTPILQQWMTQLAQIPPSTLAVVPYHSNRWQPLCGFYRRQSQNHLQSFIQQGGRSFQQWLSQIEVHAIPVDETLEPMLFNCNTPTDVQQIIQQMGDDTLL